MLKTLVNLTQQAVVEEIENILENYPYQPYRQAFAIPDLRQDLIAYVLSRIPCTYKAIEDPEVSLHNYNLTYGCLDNKLQLENLIHQGICTILPEKSEWVSRHLPKTFQCSIEPSHWFG